jgi:hypothetical protein
MTRHWTLAVLGTLVITSSVFAQPSRLPDEPAFPRTTTALEELPQVRIDISKDSLSRRELYATESVSSRLTIAIVDGRFYWGDRPGRPLTVSTSGGFTYLRSHGPGRYVRFHRVNGSLTYVEHVDMGNRSVTYWGELRILLGTS